MKYITYMILFPNGYLYTGSTGNLTMRSKEHRVRLGLGFKVVYKEAFGTREEAAKREKQLKGWRRSKKDALIEGRYAELVTLAKRRNGDLKLRPI
jgi:predicted GIY-YIG superfamily endonuclease